MDRLCAMRRTVFRRLILFGVCTLASGGIYALLAIISLDWLLDLPPAPRIAIAVVFGAGFVRAAFYWIYGPLRRPITVAEIAGRLERHFTNLNDRLLSTVSFLKSPDAGSNSLMRMVCANTERVLADLPLEGVLTFFPVAVRMALLALSAVLLIGVHRADPDWLRVGVYRYLDPLGEIEWPKDVSIQPRTGNVKAPLGESVRVEMRVTRGLHETLRGVVHLREADRPGSRSHTLGSRPHTTAVAMRRDGDLFFADIDAVTSDLVYWFEAGDASTRRSRIVVVRRPAVLDAKLIITPPPYASDRPPVEQHLGSEPISVPMSGMVSVDIQSTKPIAIDAAGYDKNVEMSKGRIGDPYQSPTPERGEAPRVGLRTASGELIPLRVDPQDRRRLTGSFVVTEDVTFRVALVDDDGFQNRGAAAHTLLARRDRPPVVTLALPRAATEVAPRAVVNIAARVEDDYGVQALDLEAQVSTSAAEDGGDRASATGGGGYIVSLMDALVMDVRHGEWTLQDVHHGGGTPGMAGTAECQWDLEAMSVTAGDVLTVAVAARDRFPTDPPGGQVGRSTPVRIRIISDLEFENRVRDELTTLESRIRQASLDQTEILDQTMALLQAERPSEQATDLSEIQRNAVADLTAKEARLGRRLNDLAKRSRRLAKRMTWNRAHEQAQVRRVENLADSLAGISSSPMAAATAALNSTRDRPEAAQEQHHLAEAVMYEETALDGLRGLLRDISRWSDFQSLVTRTRDMLNRQESIRAATGRFAKKALGKPLDSLTPGERAELNQLQRQQEQLGAEVEQLLARMRQQAETLIDNDPASAEAIEQALRQAAANELTRHLRGATGALGSNRTAAAGMDQKGVEEAIRRMIRGLQHRQSRELDELRKRVEDAEQALATILIEQQALLAATSEARMIGAEPEDYTSLADRQRMLKRNTRRVGEDLADLPRAEEVARLVGGAVGPMGLAEAALNRSAPEECETAQGDAIALLEKALGALSALNAAVREELLEHSLAQIREGLEAILDGQRVVHEGIGQLEATVAQAGRIGRLEAREASKLARQQSDVRAMIDELQPELKAVVVFDWALGRVAGWMETNRDWLTRRKIDDELSMTSQRCVRELERLLQAIVSTESLVMESEFADQEGGGAGIARQGEAARPIPTVTELLVLRAMQAQINQRTREVAAQFDPRQATERQLRQLRELAEDQIEVRRLTEMVTQRARGE